MKEDRITLKLVTGIVGLFILSFGIALTIRGNLGTSPIVVVPYVFSGIFPKLSVGLLTMLFFVIFILLEILIQKKDFQKLQLLQIPYALLLGVFIDVSLKLTNAWQVQNYLLQWLICLAGCVVMSVGIYLEIIGKFSYSPLEGFVMAVFKKTKQDFGKIKIFFDSFLIGFALIISIRYFKGFYGVREGTIASAILVGYLVQFFRNNFTFVNSIYGTVNEEQNALNEPYLKTKNYVITIAREYGSGGHAIGESIAQKLGIAFYDSKLIDLTAEKSGFTPEYVKENEQKLSNKLLYSLYKQNYAYAHEELPPKDLLFMVQTKVIRDIAAKESCVIVGRNADYILKGHPNCFNVFIHANKAFRNSRVITEYNIDPKDAEKMMEQKDRERMNYKKYYTGKDWADLKDYDLTMESSLFGIEITAAMIIDARRKALYTKDEPFLLS